MAAGDPLMFGNANAKLMNHQCDGDPCRVCGSVIVTSATAIPSNTACAVPAPQNGIIEFPGPGYADWPTTVSPPPKPPAPPQHMHYHFTPSPAPRLSDEDVERIAKRVAELLKERP